LPAACDRRAELSAQELVDLCEATRTDGAGISRAESAIRRRAGAKIRHAQ
jgi:hypothetical protein